MQKNFHVKKLIALSITSSLLGLSLNNSVLANSMPGEKGNLGERITQEMITAGELSTRRLRNEGVRIFSTSFNKIDGYGDGPVNADSPNEPGGRVSLVNNGTFLRLNGLDAQGCNECHSVISNAVFPPLLGVGGAGGINNTAFFGVDALKIDLADTQGNGFADAPGLRIANPIALHGIGGVELIANEMTVELLSIKEQAIANPGTEVELVAKGVNFGSIIFENDVLNTENVQGVDEDLILRPLGRKADFTSVRPITAGAMQFHFGIQAVELFGEDTDPDGDGVTNELTVGEVSAVHIANALSEPPEVRGRNASSRRGELVFADTGCTDCHIPTLETDRRNFVFTFPRLDEDPFANAYLEENLRRSKFPRAKNTSGVAVNLFSDLKLHNMGPELTDRTGNERAELYITAKLWGVADTAPYLHDGRATTITEAIAFHGGEAAESRADFNELSDQEKIDLLSFLGTLRAPRSAIQ